MISGLYIFDSKGDVIISKLYKSGIGRNISDVFRIHVISATSNRSEVRSPVLTLGSTSFIYIRSGLLWFCAVARSNQDCATIMSFLFRLESLLKQVVGEKVLTNDTIVNQFSTVYDVVDEAANYGFPIDTNPSYFLVNGNSELQGSFLKRPKALTKRSSGTINTLGLPKKGNNSSVSLDRGSETDSSVSWRQPGIKYRRNEVFVNIEEKVSALISPEGGLVLRASVDGTINMRTRLSGTPECRFGLGDDCVFLNAASLSLAIANSGNVVLENTKLHHSVDLSRFDSNREIQFIPPDGEFQLMSYHCVSNINLPFDIIPQVHQLGNKMVYKVEIKSLYPSKIAATGVEIRIPTPKGVVRNYASPTQGKAKVYPENSEIIWKFNKLFGDKQHTLTAEVGWDTSFAMEDEDTILKWQRPPIQINFHLDMFACSGLTVKFLKVHEKSNYRTIKWVNYMCEAGNYNVRF